MFKRSLWVATLVCATIAPGMAQDNSKQDLTVLATGDFTHETDGAPGISHRVETTAGLLVTYRRTISGPSALQIDFGAERETQYGTHGIYPLYLPNKVEASQSKVAQYDYTLSYVYKLNSKMLNSAKLHPYVLGGAGFMTFDQVAPNTTSPTKFEFVFGGGIEARLNAKTFVRVQYRSQLYRVPGLGHIFQPYVSGWAHVAQPAIGIGFHF